MVRHTGNTKAPFRDQIDTKPLKPNNDDTKVKKAKASATKKALGKKPGAANKVLKGSLEAENVLLQVKQRNTSTVMSGRRSSDKENTHPNGGQVALIRQQPVGTWGMSFQGNDSFNQETWLTYAVEVAEEFIKAKHFKELTLDGLHGLLASSDESTVSKQANPEKVRSRELYKRLDPFERQLVYGEADFMRQAAVLEDSEKAQKARIRRLKRNHDNIDAIRNVPRRDLALAEVSLAGYVAAASNPDDVLQIRLLDDIVEAEEHVGQIPKQSHRLTEKYMKWTRASGTQMRVLFQRDQRAIAGRMRATRKALKDARKAKITKPTKKSSGKSRCDSPFQGSSRRNPSKSPPYQPGKGGHCEDTDDVEELTRKSMMWPDQEQVQPTVEDENAAVSKQLESPFEALLGATEQDQEAEQVDEDAAQREKARASINKRSAATAGLDDEEIPKALHESKKARISNKDLEDEKEAARLIRTDAPSPPPARKKLSFAEYSQRHNLKATRGLLKQRMAEAEKNMQERIMKMDFWSTEVQTAEGAALLSAAGTVEQQPVPEFAQPVQVDEKGEQQVVDTMTAQPAPEIVFKVPREYRRPARDPGPTPKGSKCTYDPELDKSLNLKDMLEHKARFEQLGASPEHDVAPSDPRQTGSMGKGKAKWRPAPYSLGVWPADPTADVIEVVEKVKEPATANVEEQLTPVVQKVDEQLTAVTKKVDGQPTPAAVNVDEQVARKAKEQTVETVGAHATVEVVEEVEESAITTIEEAEQPTAEAASTTAPEPVPTPAAAPAPSGFLSSLLNSIPDASTEAPTVQTLNIPNAQQSQGWGVPTVGVTPTLPETAITRANRLGKAPPRSSAVNAAYQSLD